MPPQITIIVALIVGSLDVYENSISSQWMTLSPPRNAFTLVRFPSMLNWQTSLRWSFVIDIFLFLLSPVLETWCGLDWIGLTYGYWWIMNWAIWSTVTLTLLSTPEGVRIRGWPPVASILGQNSGPKRMDGWIWLTPLTKMSFLQCSEESWVHRCPSMHQSQGNREDTQVVHELGILSIIKRTRDKIQNLKALQSKKVKSVAARSGPSLTRMDSLLVK